MKTVSPALFFTHHSAPASLVNTNPAGSVMFQVEIYLDVFETDPFVPPAQTFGIGTSYCVVFCRQNTMLSMLYTFRNV